MKTTKAIYRWTTLIVLTILVFFIAHLFDWRLRWYHFLILFFLGTILGKFLFVVFSGINLSRVIIIDSAEDGITEFIADVQLGFSNEFRVNGIIADQWGLSEDEITLMIYTQTPRKFFKSLLSTGQNRSFTYTSGSKKIEIVYSIESHET